MKRGLALLLGLCVVVWVALRLSEGAPAEAPAEATPAGAAAGDLPPAFPGLEARRLENGLTVYAYALREVPLLSIRLVIPAGSAYDPPGQSGLAALTSRALREGAPISAAEEMGAVLDLRSFIDDAEISADGLSRDLEPLLGMVAGLVTAPPLSPEGFVRAREDLAAEDEEALDDPVEVANDAARAAVFGAHPYALPPLGTADSVRAIPREAVAAFHQRRYAPAGAALIIVGDIDAKAVLSRAAELFGPWKGGAPPDPIGRPAPPEGGRRVLVVDAPGAAEVDIRVTAPSITATSPDVAALDIVNDPLGGGFSSYLLDELRVNRGITYDATSALETYRHGGWLSVATTTPLPNARVALDVILKSLSDYRAVGPTRADLEGARAFLAADNARLFEEPVGLADALAQAFGNGSGPEALAKYPAQLGEVDLARAAKVLAQYFPTGKDDVAIVVVGPADSLAPALADLGEVTVVPIGGHYGKGPAAVASNPK